MDWFTWLSKTDLDRTLVYEYSIVFTHNELGEDDVPYFSHDFLQSMGISIAKHRLEILKLARNNKKKKKQKKGKKIYPILWFMFIVKETKNYLAKQINAIKHHENSSLSLVPKRNHSLRWKVAMLQRNKRQPLGVPECSILRNGSPRFVSGDRFLMLTNGSPVEESRSSGSGQSSNWAEYEANAESGRIARTDDGEYWSTSTEEMIKWDSMFQNLKPT